MPFTVSALSPKDFQVKLIVRTIACLFVLILIQGCTGKEESTSGEQKDTGGGKAQEETLVEKTILDLANAMTEFPKTKDPQSIRRFYAQDYAGITNGKSISLKESEKYLSDLVERLNLGEPMGISSKVSNLKANVVGTVGWVTYEYEYKLGRSGMALEADQGQCTAILRKQGGTWLIHHEHCSTASPFPFAR